MENSLIAPELYPLGSFITIWRISLNTSGPMNRWYYPRIPRATLLGEDKITPRICFCRELIDCLDAIPGAEYIDIDTPVIAFPLRISRNDPYFKPTREIMDNVPDACETNECWYTHPVFLRGIRMSAENILNEAPPRTNWWEYLENRTQRDAERSFHHEGLAYA